MVDSSVSSLQGMAFSLEERLQLGIHGLLPPCFLSQDVQVLRVLRNYELKKDDLDSEEMVYCIHPVAVRQSCSTIIDFSRIDLLFSVTRFHTYQITEIVLDIRLTVVAFGRLKVDPLLQQGVFFCFLCFSELQSKGTSRA